jgi:hypothetical protein
MLHLNFVANQFYYKVGLWFLYSNPTGTRFLIWFVEFMISNTLDEKKEKQDLHLVGLDES